MKKVLILLIALLMTLTLYACHEHTWNAANCVDPKTCSECGETQGTAFGHSWKDATCTSLKTCSVCGREEGSLADHTWKEATCTTPKTCSICGKEEAGSLATHSWTEATCTTPKTCSVCGKEEGSLAAHSWKQATCTTPKTCSVCNTIEGAADGPHNWKAATCTTPKTCSACSKSEGSTASHTWKSATCIKPKTCSVCGVTEGSTASHTWKSATCTKPKTCSVCGVTEGSTADHSWKSATCTKPKTCSVCGKTEGSTASHTWKSATCTTPKTCSVCGKTEGSTASHTWKTATCTTPKTCSVCGKSEGSKGSHSYTSGTCMYCGQNDPDYVPTFGAGEKWIVSGQFELTINSVTRHKLCNNRYSASQYGVTTAVIINYTYKNLGSSKLKIDEWSFDVYDANGTEGDPLFFANYCDHGSEAKECIKGGSCTAKLPVGLASDGNSVTIYVEEGKSTGIFTIPVTDPPVDDSGEEDKLDGCTITVDGNLPRTISYYNYNNKIDSSCSVTGIHFEVSGDDLYIYFTGRKTYDSKGSGQSAPCKIGWKLYDSNNYVVDSGTAYTLSLATGEGFKDAKDTAYNCITPGGTYKLVILNVN